MEKYGPKGEGKASQNVQTKPVKPKQNSDIDVNVGLSSRAPWFCSLCNTYTTSQQTLLGHADGKKHRAKARAFHAAQNQSNEAEKSTPNKNDGPKVESVEGNVTDNKEGNLHLDSNASIGKGGKESQAKRKREHDASVNESTNGEVIQAELSERSHHKSKKKNRSNELLDIEVGAEKHNLIEGAPQSKIKWKKLVTSTLKTNSDGIMKIKKLQKLIIKALKESGITEDEELLQDKLMQKINSSSRFTIENKRIRLAKKSEES